MFRSNSAEVRKMESTDVLASKAPQAPVYSTPRLVAIGEAVDLVQGPYANSRYKDVDRGYSFRW